MTRIIEKPLGIAVVGALAVFLLAGCATIFHGTTQGVTITSQPSGATVHLDGKQVGRTPLNINQKRGSDALSIKVTKEGYEPEVGQLPTKINHVSFWLGNLVGFGVFGSTTDYATGGMYKYKPNHFDVELTPKKESEQARQERQERTKVRRYTLTAYPSIVHELEHGGGKHLDALLDRLEVADDERSQALRTLRRIEGRTSTTAEFAARVAGSFDYTS